MYDTHFLLIPPIYLFCGNQCLNGSLIICARNDALSRIVVPTRFPPLFLHYNRLTAKTAKMVQQQSAKHGQCSVFEFTAEHRSFSGSKETLDLITF